MTTVHLIENHVATSTLCGLPSDTEGTWTRELVYADKPLDPDHSLCTDCTTARR